MLKKLYRLLSNVAWSIGLERLSVNLLLRSYDEPDETRDAPADRHVQVEGPCVVYEDTNAARELKPWTWVEGKGEVN